MRSLKQILQKAIKEGERKKEKVRKSLYFELLECRQEIETLRELGWSIREIARYITDNGYPITENSLRKYLYLIRKEAEDGKSA